MDKKPTVAAFDFDGTITTKDTFIEIIKFQKGVMYCYCGFLLFLPLLVAMKLKLYPNWRTKQQIFSFFFKGTALVEFDKMCESFARKGVSHNTHIVKSIKRHLQNGDKVVIISASPENWVFPFAKSLGILDVMGTKLEIDKNCRLTGRFSSKNCFGQEKVNRLLEKYPNRNEYYLFAYGDSRGDRELLAFADKGILVNKSSL